MLYDVIFRFAFLFSQQKQQDFGHVESMILLFSNLERLAEKWKPKFKGPSLFFFLFFFSLRIDLKKKKKKK